MNRLWKESMALNTPAGNFECEINSLLRTMKDTAEPQMILEGPGQGLAGSACDHSSCFGSLPCAEQPASRQAVWGYFNRIAS